MTEWPRFGRGISGRGGGHVRVYIHQSMPASTWGGMQAGSGGWRGYAGDRRVVDAPMIIIAARRLVAFTRTLLDVHHLRRRLLDVRRRSCRHRWICRRTTAQAWVARGLRLSRVTWLFRRLSRCAIEASGVGQCQPEASICCMAKDLPLLEEYEF